MRFIFKYINDKVIKVKAYINITIKNATEV